jgi:MFS family permease
MRCITDALPSGNEIGPFRAVEESAVAHLTTPDVRADVYAWYGLIGQTGAALGILSCGWLVQHLHTHSGWDFLSAFRLIFYIYSALGALKIALALAQSSAVEIHETEHHESDSGSAAAEEDSESRPLLPDEIPPDEIPPDHVPGDGTSSQKKDSWIGKRLLPKIDRQHAGVITTLCLLFALDSFASGLVPL